MAAPARPGSSEARVPCPLCGGLVHPIAGRCKHCKQDLTSFRAGRPQAAAALPALAQRAHHGNGHSNGHAVAPPVPVAVPRAESAPILPPRESLSMPAQHAAQPAWKRWPVVVIVVAVLAIVGAVVVMVWLPPGGSHDGGSKSLAPPPAPERMETNPIRPQADDPQPAPPQNDPWGPAPHAQAQPPARQTPDPVPDLQDPFANNGGPSDPFGPQLGNVGGGAGNLAFFGQFTRHVCARLAQCGLASEPMVDTWCNAMNRIPRSGTPPSCAAATRCLQHVDQLSCSMQTDDAGALVQLIQQLPDCLEAMQRC